MTGSHITPKHPKDDSLDLSSLFVCFLNTHAPVFRLWNYIRTAQPCPKCVYCWACCVFALGCVSEQAAALGDCQTVSDWQQRAAGLRLAEQKQTLRFQLPRVWRAVLWLVMVLNEWDSDNLWASEVLMVQESKRLWCGEQFECWWSLCFMKPLSDLFN